MESTLTALQSISSQNTCFAAFFHGGDRIAKSINKKGRIPSPLLTEFRMLNRRYIGTSCGCTVA